ncbi:MAG TPA: acyl-CoA synthetase [Acidimicrobiales bacterium]|jgi:acyl-CoA synthetase (AMP-forming)/AMP-acid ligase II|nr:acyl-CoA synthetase [Acidimicrobiales bacterium]
MAYNIADLFEHTVDRVPDRMALIVGDHHLTYRELEDRANQVAHRLGALGVGAGDHVGIYAYNCVPWVEAMLACFKLRAVPININFRYVEDELAYLLDNADCVAVVYDPEFADRLEAVRERVPIVKHTLPIDASWDRARDAEIAARDFGPRSGDDYYMLYTGGTTGMPKGVVWRQEDVFMALGQGIDAVTGHKVESDTELADAAAAGFPLISFMLPPLMHGACQWGMLGMMFKGNTVMLAERFDPAGVWDGIAREKANAIMITGDAMGRPLIEALDAEPERWDTSSMLAVSSSAALFSAPVKDRFFNRFPNLVITDSIGSSEGGFNGIAQVPKEGTAMKGGPTVKPGPDTVVVDDELNVLSPGSAIVGKVARGGNIPLGYYKDEEKTKATFVTANDGRRYVVAGDFALWEDDGTITLLGRGSMCINSGGEKIFPEEVESALKSHPDVFDALVVGATDDRWGQRVAAVVQPRPGLTPTLEELATHCRTKIAGYKVPRELHLVESISRSPSGKPDYPWAQQLVAAANARA